MSFCEFLGNLNRDQKTPATRQILGVFSLCVLATSGSLLESISRLISKAHLKSLLIEHRGDRLATRLVGRSILSKVK